MSFLIQRATGRSLTLTQVNVPVLRIGRGTNQDLRSENPAVALEHALIESDAAGYVVTDKGSITGTYVNRKPVESARLTKGDVLEIGDLRIDVQLADPEKPLFLRITVERAATVAVPEEEEEAAPVVAATPGRAIKARKIDYLNAYRLKRPWLTKVSVTALLLIVTLGVIGEVIRPERQKFFMPGGLSDAHSRPNPRNPKTCSACHLPFGGVSSSKCLECHAQQPHAQHELNAPDCTSCHAEHRGAKKLADIPDTPCVECHSNLRQHIRVPPAVMASLRFGEARYAFDDIAAITAFGERHPELAYPRDANTLRFNHKLHLSPKGVFDAQGKRPVLQCADCHVVQGEDLKPVKFMQYCHRCHRLDFDQHFPDEEVPHGGDNNMVFGTIAARYAGDRDIISKPPEEVRRILTARKSINVDKRVVDLGKKFFNIRCRICHEVRPKGDRLAATPPVIPTQWFVNTERFSHDKHKLTGCETCHDGARASAATSDVLMPKRAACTPCHAANAGASQAASTCLTCHEYHLRPQGQVNKASLAGGMGGLGGRGRMLQGILLAFIVILILVVLVPVGIALFRRLLPDRTSAPPPAAKKAPPPPPAPRPSTDIPTDKVARQPAAAPPPPDLTPRAAEPPPAPADRTSVPEASGTEMMQWNGLLACTAGPLEGQRFIIEDDGFYIGRDPVLAKVVVPDTRISKRHLRIVPRDGKVFAIDQSSTNGTFVNGQKITEAALKRGDTIVLGDNAVTFTYQI